MKALLTVLIPTFNREDRLRKTLPFFLEEKLDNIEFLVCDNGSTDGTENYIKKILVLTKSCGTRSISGIQE